MVTPKISKIFQEELKAAVKLAISGDSLDVGKSIVYYVKYNLTRENVKRSLGIDFDEAEVHPAQHTPNVADIILKKKGNIVKMLNAKTCVSGNLEATLKALQRTGRIAEDGLIIFGIACIREDSVKRILGMVIIDKKFLYNPRLTQQIMDVIDEHLKEKQKEEGCKALTTYSLNQLIAIEGLINASNAYDAALEAKMAVKDLKNEVEDLKKSVDEVKKVSEEANKASKDLKVEVEDLKNEVEDLKKDLEEKMAELIKLVSEIVKKGDLSKKEEKGP